MRLPLSTDIAGALLNSCSVQWHEAFLYMENGVFMSFGVLYSLKNIEEQANWTRNGRFEAFSGLLNVVQGFLCRF